MKKIMFNTEVGLESAVLNGSKTRTMREIRCKQSYGGVICAGFNYTHNKDKSIWFINPYDEDEGTIDGYSIQPNFGYGEEIAVAQRYEDCLTGNLIKDWDINQMIGTPGWNNKMFVKAELMPHHIRISDIKVQTPQELTEEEILKEGIWKTKSYASLTGFRYGFGDFNVSYLTAEEAFKELLQKTCGKDFWNRNPFCFVYEFELID